MDSLDYIRSSVREQAITCDVLTETEDTSYNSGSYSATDTVDVAIFSPTSSSELVPAGMDEQTTYAGHYVPEYDQNDDLVHVVEQGNHLRPQSNTALRYVVKTKMGAPDEIDPDLWVLGLDRANG